MNINKDQKLAIEYDSGPLLIIAGAGTGKTTVITERIAYLIAKKEIHPQHILALTFTEKASREMEERVDKTLPYGMTQMWISTFHAFCDRILRNEGIHIGINPGYRLLTEAETVLFLRQHIFEFQLDYFRPLGNPTKFVSGMIQHFSRLRDEDISPEEYATWVALQRKKAKKKEIESMEEIQKYQELAEAYKQYELIKGKEGYFDYADLISQTLLLFRKRPHILKKYQDQFQFILVDEFQDTNFAQNQLAIMLAGKRKNITVVGDDDQAIYRWRGAAISNMIQFRKTYPDASVVVLTKNYRSSKAILDASYGLIQHNNPDRLEVAEKIDKQLESMRRIHGELPQFIYTDRVENEAEEVAKIVRTLLNDKNEQRYQWKDVAILVRANNHAHPFTRAFERLGIPYQFLGPGQLLRQPEVKDLIAYLTVLSRIDETVAFYRILTMQWLKLDNRDVASIVAYAKRYGMSLYEVCEGIRDESLTDIKIYQSESKEKIVKLMEMIARHLGLIRKETAGQILYYFLEDTGMLSELTSYKTEKDEHIAMNIAKFFDRIKTYETEHEDATVFTVIDWIQLSLELGESPLASNSDWTQQNAVNILTIHSSKGLEFPIVFVVNLVSQRFPSTERKDQIPIPDELVKEILPSGDVHIQEERRLFYVAMTRAKDRLFLTGAKYYGDGKREKKISPFVIETVGAEHVEEIMNQPIGNTSQLSLLDWAPVHKNVSEDDVKQKKNEKHTLSYLSYSQIDTFLTCPLQYKYRYVIKLPVPQSAALSFGDTIHRTMERFYKLVQENKKPTVDDLLSIYNQQWKSIGYGNKQYEMKMRIHGEELLRGFYTNGYSPGVIPKNLEESFKLKITPALTIGGKVDRVDQLPDGKIEIIDYKTGKAPKSKDVRRDLQLTVYAMAAVDKGVYSYRPEDVIVSFYFFEGQEKVSGTRTSEQLEEAKDKIAQTAEAISESSFEPTPGKHCDYCEFRLICEAWQ